MTIRSWNRCSPGAPTPICCGATVVNGEGIAVNGTPGPDAEDELKALGQTLASL